MKRKLQGYTAKASQKTTCFLFIILRVILKHINTENATQCAYKSVLPFVDLGTSLVRKDFVEIKSSLLFGSSLEFDFCFVISENIKRKEECLKEHLTFKL